MDRIVIVDFGGQYAHLISNRIRRLGVYTDIVSNDVDVETISDAKGIILSGGPQSVNTDISPKVDKKIFELGIPILGICYGHQLFAYTFGGKIGSVPEYGKCGLNIQDSSTIFEGCGLVEEVWQNHGDAVIEAPEGFSVIANTNSNEVSSMQNSEKRFYSVQFHPEVTHSGKAGQNIFKNFTFNICGAKVSWSMEKYLEELREEIKEFVGGRNVFLLVSGGVDSTVCFALLNDILGKERVFGLHIDLGIMRKDESKKVKEMLDQKGFTNLEVYNAEEKFLEKIKNVFKPEEKRKIIGDAYLEAKDEALAKYNLTPEDWLLAQGTIYPDTIESGGTKHSDTIKTHHNRVDQIQELIKRGLIIEPIKQLYKDEVREVGKLLGLTSDLVDRHPFPGPGLAIRALCFDGNEDSIEGDIIHTDSCNFDIHVLGIKSVGIKGDARSYAHPCILSGKYNFDNLISEMTFITRKNKEVNRVIYNVSNVDVETLKLSKEYINKKYLDILREADQSVNDILRSRNLDKIIWQCPIVILPYGTEKKPYSIIIRPIDSVDAMSAQAIDLGLDVLKEMESKILEQCPEICSVFYDVTSKPPGTIEWE